MRHLGLLCFFLSLAFVAYSQNGNSNHEFNNGGSTFIQKKNFVAEQNLYVIQNSELRGQLRATGLSFFNSPVSVGSFEPATEMLDVFGNIKGRGTIFSENFINRLSAEIGEDLTIGRDLFVTRYGYFEKVGIGVSGTLTESLEVSGSIKASERLLADRLEVSSGEVATDLNVRGQFTTGGLATFSDNVIVEGLVGVGTATPSEKLDVMGNIKSSQGLFSQTVSTTDLTSETALISTTLTVEGPVSLNESVTISGITTIENNLDVAGNSSVSGMLGVGVSTPTEKLEVAGNARISETLYALGLETSSVLTGEISAPATLKILSQTQLESDLSVSGNTVVSGTMDITGQTTVQGSVGIGTDAPAEKLDVVGSAKISQSLTATSIASESFTTDNLTVTNALQVEGLSTFNDAMTVNGAVSIQSTLDASGAVTLRDRLDVSGNAGFSSKVTVEGNSIVNGNVGIGTAAPAEKLDVVGNANISETLSAKTINAEAFSTNDLSVQNTLAVGGTSSLNGALDVNADADFSGKVSVDGNSIVNGNVGIGTAAPAEKLDVVGNANVSETLSAKTINAEAFSTNDLSVQNTLAVGGASTLNGALDVNADADFSGKVSVDGNSIVNGNVGIGTAAPAEKLDVVGNANVSETLSAKTINAEAFSTNDLSVQNTLAVGGTSTLNGALDVNADADFSGKVNIGGNSIVNGNVGIGTTVPAEKLDVVGNANVSETLSAKTINAEAFSTNDLSVQNRLAVGGTSTLNGALDVNADADFSGKVNVGGSVTFSQDLKVTGSSLLTGNVGIGKAATVALDINGDIKATGSLEVAELKSDQLTLDNAAIQSLSVSGTTTTLDLTINQSLAFSNLSNANDKALFLVVDAHGKVYSRSLDSFQPVKEDEANVSIADQTLSVGTEATPEGYTVAVDGNIISNELTIQQTVDWPDYVFEADYPLPELEVVERYIKRNKHLPDVPSAQQVEANGLQVGEMNAILLRKIEELTLYIIDQNERMAELEAKLSKEVPAQTGKKIDELTLHLIMQQKQIEELQKRIK